MELYGAIFFLYFVLDPSQIFVRSLNTKHRYNESACVTGQWNAVVRMHDKSRVHATGVLVSVLKIVYILNNIGLILKQMT